MSTSGRAVVRMAALASAAAVAAAAGAGAGCTERLLLPGGLRDAGGNVGDDGGASDRGGFGGGSGGREGGGGSGGGGNRPPGGFDGGPTCADPVRLSAVRRSADLLLVVGRNASMTARFGSGTRMSITQEILDGLIDARHTALRFGYQGFPSSEPVCAAGGGCCGASQPVHPTPSSFAAVSEQLWRCDGPGCALPLPARPVGDALARARELYEHFDDKVTDRYVLLTVDGAPSCPAVDEARACDAATLEVSLLVSMGIKTYVVGIGDDASDDPCLYQLALQGGTMDGRGPLTYGARNPDELADLLGGIVNVVAATSCAIDLASIPNDANRISVYVDGVEVPRDSSNGWTFHGPSRTRIDLFGSWCGRVQAAAPSDIEVWGGCAPCGRDIPCH